MKLSYLFIRVSVMSACVAALVCGPGAAFGQIPGADKNASGMSAAMMKFFGNNTNFIAKAEVHVLDKNHQETTTLPMGFEMLGSRVRVDVNMTELKSKEMPPEALAMMKQMGMDQMSTIILPDKKTVLTIYPSLKSYAETPLPKDEVEASAVDYKVEKTRLAKETIDGHSCEKNNVTLTNDKGEKQTAVLWNASDLKDFPVQMQIAADDSTLVLKFKDVKLGRPESSHFEAPAGLTKYNDINTLMMEAAAKKSGAGAAK